MKLLLLKAWEHHEFVQCNCVINCLKKQVIELWLLNQSNHTDSLVLLTVNISAEIKNIKTSHLL